MKARENQKTRARTVSRLGVPTAPLAGRAGRSLGMPPPALTPSKESNRPPSAETEAHSPNATKSPPALTPSASRARHAGDRLGDGVSWDELSQKYVDLQEQYEKLQPLTSKLQNEVKKKKESYLRREVQYKSEISHIKDVLEKTVLCRGGQESSMTSMRNMHKQASALINLSVCRGEGRVCPAGALKPGPDHSKIRVVAPVRPLATKRMPLTHVVTANLMNVHTNLLSSVADYKRSGRNEIASRSGDGGARKKPLAPVPLQYH